jgi:hypothetical protein
MRGKKKWRRRRTLAVVKQQQCQWNCFSLIQCNGGPMTRFEYIAIFYGIIVGLALENVASSFHKLFAAGARVRWHWMAPTNAIGTSIATFSQFWIWWLARNNPDVGELTVLAFLPGALASILLYLVCAATLPDEIPETGIDLRKFYFASARQFWSLAVALVLLRSGLVVLDILRTNFASQSMQRDIPSLLFLLAVATLAGSMIYIRAYWWHAVGIIAMTAMTVLYFGLMKI